jgi:hypothetical protein
MPSLQIGKDLKAAIPLAETRSILEEIAAEDRKLRDQQGLSALNLGLGIVAWEEADETYCFAPLYLQSIELDISRESIRVRSTGAAPELNETLLARLGFPDTRCRTSFQKIRKPTFIPSSLATRIGLSWDRSIRPAG